MTLLSVCPSMSPGTALLRHASEPVSIAPLMLSQLRQIFTRPRDPKQSTDFSFTRFLVPFLCEYQGWTIFANGDMIFRKDIAELWKLRDDKYAIQVVKHEHIPQRSEKFLGHLQTAYARKNWSSLILFNNARCRALTIDYVHSAAGLYLHQFKWLKDDDLIGALPKQWNHPVDHDPAEPLENIANLHFTDGGPWLESHAQCGHASEWKSELDLMLSPVTNRQT